MGILQPVSGADDRLGSTSAVSGFLRHGCFTPQTGNRSARLERQKSAKTGRERAQQLYSITSSARARSVGGTSRPSARAQVDDQHELGGLRDG